MKYYHEHINMLKCEMEGRLPSAWEMKKENTQEIKNYTIEPTLKETVFIVLNNQGVGSIKNCSANELHLINI